VLRKLSTLALGLLALLALAPAAMAATGLGAQRVAPEAKNKPRPPQRDNGLIAPRAVCANQSSLDLPLGVQREAMRCMTEYARRHAGIAGLGEARQLDRSASGKSQDILRCDSFSHYACGRDFTYWMRQSGYLAASCWRAGENLAWGTGEAGSVRAIFRAWMRSPGHRRNILGRFRQIGIGLQIGDLEGRSATHVWTQHFGSHC
jgi:Cysteine-rich secretory protein family